MGDDAHTLLKNREEFFKRKGWKRMEADPAAGSCVQRCFRGPPENQYHCKNSFNLKEPSQKAEPHFENVQPNYDPVTNDAKI